MKRCRRILTFFFCFFMLCFFSGCGFLDTYLTYENYSKIQAGMTYEEVVNVMQGNEGVLDTTSSYGGYTLSFYTWSDELGFKCIVVGFENGRVSTKSQTGLG